MDLENFPINPKAFEMMEWITGNGFYEHSYVGKWLFEVIGKEMEDANRLFEELREQMFSETATWGIVYHEQKYGIPVNDKMSLEERRREVIKKRSIRYPMNPARLEKLTAIFIGREVTYVHVLENIALGVFQVTIKEEDSTGADYPGLIQYIKKLKPSHLSFLMQGYFIAHVMHFLQTSTPDLRIGSEFYIRNICEPLLLDGKWYINAAYYLDGNKVEYLYQVHPAHLKIQTAIETRMNCDNHLLIEKNLFFMDGIWRLDGEKTLDAEIRTCKVM